MVGELRAGDPRSVGPYQLVGRLGSGGMGQVYLGRSAGGRPVAAKVIRPDLADEPGFRARFAREVAAARNVGGLFTALVVDGDMDALQPGLATGSRCTSPAACTAARPSASPAASRSTEAGGSGPCASTASASDGPGT